MSAHWKIDETSLKRKMLFRLLKSFDFDNPIFRHEPISAPIADTFLADTNDTFIFAFQSEC